MTKTERNLWRDALSYRFDIAELFRRHGKELVIFSQRDYDRMLKKLKKYPEVLKAFQKLNIDMTPMVITPPNGKLRRRN